MGAFPCFQLVPGLESIAMCGRGQEPTEVQMAGTLLHTGTITPEIENIAFSRVLIRSLGTQELEDSTDDSRKWFF